MPYGYPTPNGYMGRVQERMMLFSSEQDYIDYIEDEEESA